MVGGDIMNDIYLIIISDQYPAFYIFARTQQGAVDAVSRYLSDNGYQNASASHTWNVEPINEAYTNDNSIILMANY